MCIRDRSRAAPRPLRDRSNSCPSFGGERPRQCAPRVRSRVGSGARVERRGSTSRSLALNPAAMWTLLRRPLASDPRGRETGGYPRYDRSPANYFPGRNQLTPARQTNQPDKNRHGQFGVPNPAVSPTTTNSRRRRRGKSNPNVPLPLVVATVRGAASHAAEPSGHLSVNAG